MKKIFLLPIIFLSITVYGNEIVPGPKVWYSISEKIFKESHQFMMLDTEDSKNQTKKKAPKVKVLKVSTKFKQKDEIVIPDFFALPITKNVWFLPE